MDGEVRRGDEGCAPPDRDFLLLHMAGLVGGPRQALIRAVSGF